MSCSAAAAITVSQRPKAHFCVWEEGKPPLAPHLLVCRSAAVYSNIQAAGAGLISWLARHLQLQRARECNAVLDTQPSNADVRAVWSAPLRTAPSTPHGIEQRTVIEIVEERTVWAKDGGQVWLRYKPLPGDSKQCWVQQRCVSGSWEQVPADDAAELQARPPRHCSCS